MANSYSSTYCSFHSKSGVHMFLAICSFLREFQASISCIISSSEGSRTQPGRGQTSAGPERRGGAANGGRFVKLSTDRAMLCSAACQLELG